MIVTPIKTKSITVGDTLFPILDQYVQDIKEKDIVVITSKIVGICEGSIVKNDGTHDKYDLIKKHSQKYLQSPAMDKYHIMITINHGMMIASGGIDESNGNGYYILWPKDPDKSADMLWKYLCHKHSLKRLGVIITDSHIAPLRWGTTGVGLSWCGFEPLQSYIGAPDIFGRPLQFTHANILDGLASAAVVTMGEGKEQTPLALIRDAGMVTFQNRPPTKAERQNLQISLEDDIYAPLLTSVKWNS